MIHSWSSKSEWVIFVVNWFQIDTFMWWFTVWMKSFNSWYLLWIDFKLILLCDDSQLLKDIRTLETCCELISNWYFYVMIHSPHSLAGFFLCVVNWFQIDTFMWWFTVGNFQRREWVLLWIDFKLILLCDDSQLVANPPFSVGSCELISNWYFYVMIHSYAIWKDSNSLVVNWFQIDTFMWWFTVSLNFQAQDVLLWIDFKLILLCDDSQLLQPRNLNWKCCELISNWYFYVMIHSTGSMLVV